MREIQGDVDQINVFFHPHDRRRDEKTSPSGHGRAPVLKALGQVRLHAVVVQPHEIKPVHVVGTPELERVHYRIDVLWGTNTSILIFSQ